MAITYGDIAGQEPSTVSFRVETAVIDRNSTNVHREILVFGDPESSLGVARVVAAAPDSTHYGAVVRQVGYVAPSTTASISTGSVRVHQSTAADLNVTVAGYIAPSTVVSVSTGSVRVHQSTAADLNVTVAGYVAPSTVVTVSTGSVRVHQSSAADLNVTVAGYSTVVSLSAGWDSTYASGAKSSTGDTTILSSAASTRWAVFGYHFTVDSTSPTLVRLLNGSTLEMARWQFRAPSSVSVGANLAVPMPAYLYRGTASNPIVLYTDSTATVHYALQAYRMS